MFEEAELDDSQKATWREGHKLSDKAKAKAGIKSVVKRVTGKTADAKEEAAELYREAAGKYESVHDWLGAAHAFEKAAQVDPRPYDAAAFLIQAAQARRSGEDLVGQANNLGHAAAIFTEKGPRRRAAQVLRDLAKVYDELDARAEALKTWRAALNAATKSGAASLALSARKGLAYAAARTGDYRVATESLEAVILETREDARARWSLKGLLLNAGLCYAANGDTVGLEKALVSWAKLDRAFSATKEHAALAQIVAALKRHDVTGVEQALFQLDKQHRLDRWQIDLGLRIKEVAGSLS